MSTIIAVYALLGWLNACSNEFGGLFSFTSVVKIFDIFFMFISFFQPR